MAAACGVAAAQGATDAALRGRVVDARGAALAGVRVEVRPGSLAVENGLTAGADITAGADVTAVGMFAQTDRHGGFTMLGLVPGEYRAEVILPGGLGRMGPVAIVLGAGGVEDWELRVGVGFPWVTLSAVPLESGSGDEGDSRASEVSQSGTQVQGRARAADKSGSKQVDAAGMGARLGGLGAEDGAAASAEELSGAGQDATLAGGGTVQGDTTGEDDSTTAREEREAGGEGAGLSFHGLPVRENTASVDGLSGDEGFVGGPRGAGGGRVGSGFSQGIGRTVKVLPHTFSAQYGGGAGGIVTMTSQGAEAHLHGTASAQVRQSGWAAVNPYAVVTRYNGGAVASALERPASSTVMGALGVGVPVRLPGVFRGWRSGIFGAGEEQARSETLVSTPLTASFFNLTADQRALLGNRGVSTGATKAALEFLDGLAGQGTVRSVRTQGSVRLDAAPDDADRVSVGVQIGRGTAPVTGGSGTAEGVINRAISSVGTSEVETEAYTVGWHRSLSARAGNSLRAQFAHELLFENPAASVAGVPAIGPGGYAPQVSIQPEGFSYGTPASLGRVAYPDEQRLEVADSFGLRLGRNVLTLGGDWSRLHDEVLSATDIEGAFSYNNTTASGHDGGLVDWITDYTFNVSAYPNGGCPSVFASVHYFCFHSYTQGFTGAATEFVTHQVAGFAENSVRLRRDLQLSVGARYDYLLLPFPQQPNLALDTALRGFGGTVSGVTSSFPEDRNNFGPRVSMVWSPGGARRGERWFTAHAGYGAFYGRPPGAALNAALADTALPSSTSRIRITPKTEVNCPQVANQGFGYPCAFEKLPTGVVGQTTSALVFATNFRLPVVQRATFGLERKVGRRLAVNASYATAWATQLPESVDLNIAPSTGMAKYVLQGGDGHPGLRTGEIFVVPSYSARKSTKFGPVTALVSNANATYHSGTVGADLRDFHGWSGRGVYTFSRAIDYGPQNSATPRQNGQFDPFTDGYDKGLSDLNFAHHFAGSVTYRSSLASGPREVRAAVSGWSFAAVGVAGSGAPYSYGIYGGTRLSGGRESINGSGGAVYLPTIGRNTLRLAPRGVVNLRTARDLPVHGAMRLSVQAQAYNLLNSVSLSRVETRAFLLGTPSTSGAPTPLVFQDAATIANEGLTNPAFGTALSSTSGASRERQLEMGMRLSF